MGTVFRNFVFLVIGTGFISSLANVAFCQTEKIDWKEEMNGVWTIDRRATSKLLTKNYPKVDIAYLGMAPQSMERIRFSKDLSPKSKSENGREFQVVLKTVKADKALIHVHFLENGKEHVATFRPISKHSIALQRPLTPFGTLEVVYKRVIDSHDTSSVRHLGKLQGNWIWNETLSKRCWEKYVPKDYRKSYQEFFNGQKGVVKQFRLQGTEISYPLEGSSNLLEPVKDDRDSLFTSTKFLPSRIEFHLISDNHVVLVDYSKQIIASYQKDTTEKQTVNLAKVRLPRVGSPKFFWLNLSREERPVKERSSDLNPIIARDEKVELTQVQVGRLNSSSALKSVDLNQSALRFVVKQKVPNFQNHGYDARISLLLDKDIKDDQGTVLRKKDQPWLNRRITKWSNSLPSFSCQLSSMPSKKAKAIIGISGKFRFHFFKKLVVKIDDFENFEQAKKQNPSLQDLNFTISTDRSQYPRIRFKGDGVFERIDLMAIVDSKGKLKVPNSLGKSKNERSYGFPGRIPKKVTCWVEVNALVKVVDVPFELKNIPLP